MLRRKTNGRVSAEPAIPAEAPTAVIPPAPPVTPPLAPFGYGNGHPLVTVPQNSTKRTVLTVVVAVVLSLLLTAAAAGAVFVYRDKSSQISDLRASNTKLAAAKDALESDLAGSRKASKELQAKLVGANKTLRNAKGDLAKAKADAKAQYSAGFVDGSSSGYSEGSENGYSAGSVTGYSGGWDDGYDSGYDAGWDAGYYYCQSVGC